MGIDGVGGVSVYKKIYFLALFLHLIIWDRWGRRCLSIKNIFSGPFLHLIICAYCCCGVKRFNPFAAVLHHAPVAAFDCIRAFFHWITCAFGAINLIIVDPAFVPFCKCHLTPPVVAAEDSLVGGGIFTRYEAQRCGS